MPFSEERLAEIREFRGLTPSQLGRRTGLNRSGIGNLENGTTKDPRGSTVEALAEALDVTGDWLQGYGPDMAVEKAAVLQSLERFKKTEGGRYENFDDAALGRAATYEGAVNTVANWRAFVEMSTKAWGAKPKARKMPRPAKTTSSLKLHKGRSGSSEPLGL